MLGSKAVAVLVGMLGLVVAHRVAPTAKTGDVTSPSKTSCDEIRRNLEHILMASLRETNSKHKRMFLNMLPGFLSLHLPTLCDTIDPPPSRTSPSGSLSVKRTAPSRPKRAFFFGNGFPSGNGFLFGNGMSSNGKSKDAGDHPQNGGFFFGNGFGNGKIKDPGDHPPNGLNGMNGFLQLALLSSVLNGGLNGYAYNGGKNGEKNGGNGSLNGATIEVSLP